MTTSSRRSPRYFSSRRVWIVGPHSSPKGLGTIWATRSGRDLDASTIRRASAALADIRASVRTCFPAARAAQVTSQCMYGQVPIMTASTSGEWTSDCQSGKTLGMPNSWATRALDCGERFTTPTTSTPSIARNPGMCRSAYSLPLRQP